MKTDSYMPCAFRYSLTCWLDIFVPFDSLRAEPLVGTVLPFFDSCQPSLDLQVATHSSPDDCWISLHGNVYDITRLVAENQGPLVQPLLRVAGSDISHWFDYTTTERLVSGEDTAQFIEIKTHVDPVTNLKRPYVPMGRFLDVPPTEPVTDWDTIPSRPWWKNETLVIGKLSQTQEDPSQECPNRTRTFDGSSRRRDYRRNTRSLFGIQLACGKLYLEGVAQGK